MKFTKMANNATVERKWTVIDASGVPFGRVITQAAHILRGKHKPSFTPHVDCGDYVVIINVQDVKFTGTKLKTKEYHRHSGYFGGVKSEKASDLLLNKPEKLFKLATRGMLPKTRLAVGMLKRLKIYSGAEHPHQAQIKG
jgi:large subunit ribosomal protein L13